MHLRQFREILSNAPTTPTFFIVDIASPPPHNRTLTLSRTNSVTTSVLDFINRPYIEITNTFVGSPTNVVLGGQGERSSRRSPVRPSLLTVPIQVVK